VQREALIRKGKGDVLTRPLTPRPRWYPAKAYAQRLRWQRVDLARYGALPRAKLARAPSRPPGVEPAGGVVERNNRPLPFPAGGPVDH
jgi:hypothetical protein